MLSPPSESNPYGITGGPYEEYFYLELPIQDTSIKKRYVYVKDRSVMFPMHFGLELAAVMIQKPERANWKNCMQSESEEVALVGKFRKSFEKYDFT